MNRKKTVFAAGILLAAALCGVASAGDSVQRVTLDIKPQPISKALMDLGEQAGLQVLVRGEDIQSERALAPAVTGEITVQAALERILTNTGLTYEFLDERTVRVSRAKSGSTSAVQHGANEMRLAQTGTAAAQAADQGSAPADPGVEEIVVTATKRSQNIQDTAMSITALSSTEIERRGFVSMADYLRTLPGVSQIDAGVGRNAIVIRGVSAAPQTDAARMGPTVGIYLSDIPLAGYSVNRDSVDLKLVDMERVEVIRGPQGTLYGASSLGGAVRNVPVAPKLSELEGRVQMGYSSTSGEGGDNSMGVGIVNLPLVRDRLAVRAVAYKYENSGYIDNVAASYAPFAAAAASWGVGSSAVDQTDVGNDSYTGGRISALWQPTDRAKVTLSYITQDLEQDGFPEVQQRLPGKFQQTRIKLSPLVGGGNERLTDDIDIAAAQIEYGFDWATVYSSSAWIEEKGLHARDIGSFFGGRPYPQLWTSSNDIFVQEVRLASQFKGPLQFLLGAFYQDADSFETADNYYGGAPQLNPFGTSPVLGDLTAKNTFDQKALFGEVSYDLTAKLTLTAGMRYFDYDKKEISINGPTAQIPTASTTTLESGERDATHKLNVTYKPGGNSLLYAQWAEGFRLGDPIAPANPLCDLDRDGFIDGTRISSGARQLDSDSLASYELGAKFTMLEGRVTLSAAVYRNEWQGLPILVVVQCGRSPSVNAGEARTQGVELEGAVLLRQGLKAYFGTSFLNAELTKDAIDLGQAGDRLPGSPKFTLNTGLEYGFNLWSQRAFARVDYAYVGGYYNNLQERGVEAGDYHLLGMRVGLLIRDRWNVELYGQNLLNADEYTWADTVFPNADARAVRQRPRTVGASLAYRF